jgi:hypothetical protein
MLTLHPKAQGVQNLDPAGSATGRQWWFANHAASPWNSTTRPWTISPIVLNISAVSYQPPQESRPLPSSSSTRKQ